MLEEFKFCVKTSVVFILWSFFEVWCFRLKVHFIHSGSEGLKVRQHDIKGK